MSIWMLEILAQLTCVFEDFENIGFDPHLLMAYYVHKLLLRANGQDIGSQVMTPYTHGGPFSQVLLGSLQCM